MIYMLIKISKCFGELKSLQETRGMLRCTSWMGACIELLKLLFLPTCIEFLKRMGKYIHIYICTLELSYEILP